MTPVFWLSFVDTITDVALGCAFVAGADLADAITRSHLLGLIPRRQVQVLAIEVPVAAVLPYPVDSFWSVAEALDAGVLTLSDLGPNTLATLEKKEGSD